MPACERCWRDAYGDPERYRELLELRKDDPCSPEAQAGPDAKKCPKCDRWAIHQYAGVCMACDYSTARALAGHDTGGREER